MFIKQGFSIFWQWLCREALLYFERLLEKLETLFLVPQNALKTLLVFIT